MLSIHCRCVTNILKISMKKFDPENNMIYLQGLNITIFQQLHIAGGILKALLAANFLLFTVLKVLSKVWLHAFHADLYLWNALLMYINIFFISCGLKLPARFDKIIIYAKND